MRDDLEGLSFVVWIMMLGGGLAYAVSALVTGSGLLWILAGACVVGCVCLTLYWEHRG
jgi:hypothetical protein